MKRGSGVSQRVILAGWLLLGIGLLIGTAEAQQTETVECAEGETIAEALTEAEPGEPLLVVVQGTCNENVTITPDDVTLQGDPGIGGAVTAADPTRDTILIQAARRVVIDNLTVSGGHNGIRGVEEAAFTVQNSIVRDNAEDGVAVDGGSAIITDNEIRANGQDGVSVVRSGFARIGLTQAGEAGPNVITDNGDEGIGIANSATATIFANTVTANASSGIQILRASALSLGENTIQGNSGNGILVFGGGNLLQGLRGRDTIQGNFGSGVAGILNASLDIRNATISGNNVNGIFLNRHSVLQIRNSAISGNANDGIQVAGDSGLFLLNPLVTVTGHGGFGIQCFDTESSIRGNTSGVTGNTAGDVSPSCTGF